VNRDLGDPAGLATLSTGRKLAIGAVYLAQQAAQSLARLRALVPVPAPRAAKRPAAPRRPRRAPAFSSFVMPVLALVIGVLPIAALSLIYGHDALDSLFAQEEDSVSAPAAGLGAPPVPAATQPLGSAGAPPAGESRSTQPADTTLAANTAPAAGADTTAAPSVAPADVPATPVAPAAAPTQVAAVPAGAPPSRGAATLRPVLDERFADNRNNWPHNTDSTAWLANGAYRLVARQPSQFVALGAPGAQSYRDVTVTANFHKLAGPAGGGYGIIVRDQPGGPRDGVNQSGRFYVLEAGDRGEIGIWRRDGNRWVDVVPWTKSDAVRPGTEPNELTVQAIGPRLTFLVNGIQVASVDDSALAEGAVGVFVGGDLNDVALDRFRIEVPT
jgi:hypothetical protein